MRRLVVVVLVALALPSVALPSIARADGPVVLPTVVVHGRAQSPQVFTTLGRARTARADAELRTDLVREVPRTVERAPF